MQKTIPSRLDALVLTLFALVAAAAVGWWFWQGRAVDLPSVDNVRLQCASYAPYRLEGETPYDPNMHVSEARIAEDLRIIAAQTSCVRTYSVNQGLDAVPKVARSLGMKVLVGAWLGRNRSDNEGELTKAIALAREYPDTVRGLVIGNEVLLRRELSEQELAGYIRRAREGAAPVPVTYADVWEFWLAHPKLADSVDFVTIHILPYWEDEPVGIDKAIAHVLEIATKMREVAGGKSILIGETGWPSAGRQRRDAVPGLVEEARFLREFARAAQTAGLQYNVIEAFDQPWKRKLEGAMGGYWGLFDSAGHQKFPWTGPVREISDWQQGPIAAGIVAVACAMLALLLRHGWFGTSVMFLTGATIGAVAPAQWRYLVQWNRDWTEWLAAGGWSLLALLLVLVAGERLAARRIDALPSAMELVEGGRLRGAFPPRVRAIGLLRFALLFGAAFMTVLLVFDSRYRGFPIMLYGPPTALWLIAWLFGERAPARRHEEALLGLVVGAGAIYVVIAEQLSNLQAVRFEAVMLVLAGCATDFRYGLDVIFGRRQAASSPASSPNAAGS